MGNTLVLKNPTQTLSHQLRQTLSNSPVIINVLDQPTVKIMSKIKQWKIIQLILIYFSINPLPQTQFIHLNCLQQTIFSHLKMLSLSRIRLDSVECFSRLRSPVLQLLFVDANCITSAQSLRKLHSKKIVYMSLHNNHIQSDERLSEGHFPAIAYSIFFRNGCVRSQESFDGVGQLRSFIVKTQFRGSVSVDLKKQHWPTYNQKRQKIPFLFQKKFSALAKK